MSRFSKGMRSIYGALCFTVCFSGLAEANATSRFASFLGAWRGSGHIVDTNGKAERIACRANYSPSGEGEALTQTLVCAGDSYKFDVRSFIVSDSQGVQGHWEESTRNATGQVVGAIADGQFAGNIVGSGFSAHITLKTVGRKQTVNITPEGGEIERVDVVLLHE